MKRKRLIVRAVSLFMVGLITTLAFVIPTSAIMAEYPTQYNVTYADCVMPFNVNFVGSDGSLDYVYSVPIGYNSPVIQTGVQGHDTLMGRVHGNDGVIANTATLEYYYYPTEWRIGYDGTDYGNGWGGVPVELRIDNTELNGKTIVIEAPTFYVNPLVSNWYNVANTDTYNRWAMGAFRMPTLSDSSTQAYVGRYTVSANIVDDVGTKHPVSYSKVIDTRIDNDWIPMLEPSIFQEYVVNDIQETGYNRIVAVTDFKAYVDCDYYELVSPDISTIDVWVQFRNGTLTRQEQFMLTDYVGQTFGSWLADNIDLGDNFYVDSSSEGIEITYTYGGDEYKGFITDGTDNVTSRTVIQGGVTYTCHCEYVEPTPTYTKADLIGTWTKNDNASSLSQKTLFIYGLNFDDEYFIGSCTRSNGSNGIEYASTLNEQFDVGTCYIGLMANGSGGLVFGSTTSNSKTWTLTSIRSLLFDSNILADKVIVTDEFYSWLTTNFTKQTTASVITLSNQPMVADVGDNWVMVDNSPLKATGIDVSYPVYERDEFEGELALNYGYPDFNRYISKFRGVGNLDINADFTGWIATATSGFLNFELLPNFSIGGVLAILVGFSLVILFLKIFAGG